MIERTEAIVLKTIDYGETSQIVSLFTRLRGRMSVIAKGSRRPRSRFGSTLQPMSIIQAVYYFRTGRTLQTLKETTHVARLQRLTANVHRLGGAFRIVELVRGLTEEGDPSPTLFREMMQALVYLDSSDERPENVLPHFQLRLASELGFAPAVRREDVQLVPAGGGILDLETGEIAVAARPGNRTVKASRTALRAFAIFARTDLPTALCLRLEPLELEETLRLTNTYLRFHVEGRYPDRSEAVMQQLRHGAA